MIAEKRKLLLNKVAEYIKSKIDIEEEVNLIFICTHNSRRSHLGQIWAQLAAFRYGFNQIKCYSGGTEATALYPEIAATLKRDGLQVLKISEGLNPVYAIKERGNQQPIIAFSKKYDHPFNPSTSFAAIMTCSEADDNCPVVAGAEIRIPITYVDPKVSDNTVDQKKVYAERSIQIKTEMNYIFKKINDELQS